MQLVEEMRAIWGVPKAANGLIPIADQPDVFLEVPRAFVFDNGDDVPRILVFASRNAYRKSIPYFANIGYGFRGERVRPVYRSSIENWGDRCLVVVDRAKFKAEGALWVFHTDANGGLLDTVVPFDAALIGRVKTDVLAFDLPTIALKAVYVLAEQAVRLK